MDFIGRILGWSLLGGLIGGGMSFFVPNLKWTRGLAGGAIGGFLGALGFLLADLALGGLPGRVVGATILGFFIGLMVAIAEWASRRSWLEIAFSPREFRTVTLGTQPVTIGGDERRASVFIPGVPPISYRFRMDGERILCEDIVAEQTMEVQPGATRMLGKVTIRVCSVASARKSGYTLRLADGRTFTLGEGMPFTEQDLVGLRPHGLDGIVALVSSRPNDPKSLHLRNRSQQSWTVSGADGVQQTVEPGRGLELATGMEIVFGELRGTLTRE